MFNKVLIANRGEIASRIIRACNNLDIQTIAVYSKADCEAPFVKEANEAFLIGEARVDQSYLNIEKIMELAINLKVDAIHPGYGFLSENAEFARLCEQSGIVFIGPSAKNIEQMASKILSRQLMQDAGVPIIPGTINAVETVEEALEVSTEIGYPVMLKASAGGGGVGLQVVQTPNELIDTFQNNKERAAKFFKDGSMFIEKVIENARHIEVQVAADHFGNTVHLFERECSIQRRNQKVIEEAPSTFVNELLRNKLGEIAIKAIKSIGYTNVGTIEFLVDEQENIYFLEMNTRIQVEHPVTEEVTGIDLVQTQFKIANGQALDMTQKELTITGHAIEVRIYAEDPVRFFPSPGKITKLSLPEADYIRHELTIKEEYTVTPFYDPMIAKLIVTGKDRNEVIDRLEKALENYEIEGIKTNIPMLLETIRHNAFRNGETTTDFVNTYYLSQYQS